MLLKIFHAMSNMPKPTVASSVSRAKVSKSVMEHPLFRICVRGEQQKCVNPDAKPERRDRMPYVDSILEISITDASPFFNRAGRLFVSGWWTFPPQTGILKQNKHGLHRRRNLSWKTLTNF